MEERENFEGDYFQLISEEKNILLENTKDPM